MLDVDALEELHEYASKRVQEAVPAMTPRFYPVEEGYKILLAKSPKDDPKLKYRKEVQARAEAGHGKFSVIARRILAGKFHHQDTRTLRDTKEQEFNNFAFFLYGRTAVRPNESPNFSPYLILDPK